MALAVLMQCWTFNILKATLKPTAKSFNHVVDSAMFACRASQVSSPEGTSQGHRPSET